MSQRSCSTSEPAMTNGNVTIRATRVISIIAAVALGWSFVFLLPAHSPYFSVVFFCSVITLLAIPFLKSPAASGLLKTAALLIAIIITIGVGLFLVTLIPTWVLTVLGSLTAL